MKQFYNAELDLFARRSAYKWLFGLMVAVTLSLSIASILVPILLVLGII